MSIILSIAKRGVIDLEHQIFELELQIRVRTELQELDTATVLKLKQEQQELQDYIEQNTKSRENSNG